jgi:signal transduction histidine kinase
MGRDLLGSFGVGTFGDEPLIDPSESELEFLTVLGVQLASAYSRLQLLDQQRRDADERAATRASPANAAAVELMGVLASGVAHDLANYLTVIQSSVELLALDSSDQRPWPMSISPSARRAAWSRSCCRWADRSLCGASASTSTSGSPGTCSSSRARCHATCV